MDQRMSFVVRVAEGERMSDLCREYGISRKTGYKLKARFEREGVTGLLDRSRRPARSPQRTPKEIVARVIELREQRPTWGPKKLRARLENDEPEIHWPAPSTIGLLLKDAGLVSGRKKRRRAWPSPASQRVDGGEPNDLWGIDFKGDFRTKDGRRCYPLTVSDHFSRFFLACEGLESTAAAAAWPVMVEAFRTYGIPARIRSDNGSPFASTGLAGLTRFSVQFMRLGIRLERIEPGHPEQNGRHERIHLTLKEDTLRPVAANILQQQERFDDFRAIYNDERPHEALNMATPSSIYSPSTRKFPERLGRLEYPLHDEVRLVAESGSIRFRGSAINVSRALTGERIGLREVSDGCWLVTFMNLDLGYFDVENGKIMPLPIG